VRGGPTGRGWSGGKGGGVFKKGRDPDKRKFPEGGIGVNQLGSQNSGKQIRKEGGDGGPTSVFKEINIPGGASRAEGGTKKNHIEMRLGIDSSDRKTYINLILRKETKNSREKRGL